MRGYSWRKGVPTEYTVVYEEGPTSWGAYVPDVPGELVAGDTREEIERLIADAVAFHLDGLLEEGLPIPISSSYAGDVEASPAA